MDALSTCGDLVLFSQHADKPPKTKRNSQGWFMGMATAAGVPPAVSLPAVLFAAATAPASAAFTAAVIRNGLTLR